MLKNLSYNCKKTKDLLIDRVGKPLTLFERLKIGGNGSDKLIITDASNDIVELLKLDNNINQCNIEIRSNGIIVRFRALLETYGLVIPFYKMVIYKGEKIKKNNISFLRSSQKGVTIDQVKKILGKKAKRNLKKFETIDLNKIK